MQAAHAISKPRAVTFLNSIVDPKRCCGQLAGRREASAIFRHLFDRRLGDGRAFHRPITSSGVALSDILPVVPGA